MNKAAAELSLANDFIFGEVMRQPENVKPLLEAVLEKKIAEITYIEKQQDIKDGFELHGVRLDISLEDSERTQYAWRCRPAAPMTWSAGSGITRVPWTGEPWRYLSAIGT